MSNEKHEHNCSCGHHHEHEHGCGCGHNHHEYEHSCGCGHNHEHGEHHHCNCGESHVKKMDFTAVQEQILMELAHKTYLPLVRFIMLSTKADEAASIALSPVYIMSENDTIETIKQTGKMLLELEANGYITLDYEEELGKYEYSEYYNSPVFADFKEVVAQGSKKENFLFDIAEIEKGSIALTEEIQHRLTHHHE